MTFRRALTEAQIQATLERHGYPANEPLFGIQYGEITTVNVEGARLQVPADVLAMKPTEETSTRARSSLFDHGGDAA